VQVSAEVRLSEALRSLALPAAAVRGILRLTEPPSGSVRLIWTDAPTLWLNDIENDPETAKWPTSLRVLLQQRYPGRLPMIRRNLFNAIFVLDITTREACGLPLPRSTYE
jgi:UDP-glucose:glycoprotein glucosyltransferase